MRFSSIPPPLSLFAAPRPEYARLVASTCCVRAFDVRGNGSSLRLNISRVSWKSLASVKCIGWIIFNGKTRVSSWNDYEQFLFLTRVTLNFKCFKMFMTPLVEII